MNSVGIRILVGVVALEGMHDDVAEPDRMRHSRRVILPNLASSAPTN